MTDPRLTPARPDLAAAHLRGKYQAQNFVEGRPAAVIAASVPLRKRPCAGSGWESEALHGETVTVYEERDGWAWVQLGRDGYVGYLASAALGAGAAPTHRVAVLRTHG